MIKPSGTEEAVLWFETSGGAGLSLPSSPCVWETFLAYPEGLLSTRFSAPGTQAVSRDRDWG